MTPETKAAFFTSPVASPARGLIGHAVALPRDKQSQRIALPRTGEERDLVLPLMDTQRFRVGRRDDAFAGDSIGERVTHDLDIERVAVFEFTEPG